MNLDSIVARSRDFSSEPTTAMPNHPVYSVEQAIHHLTQYRPEKEQQLYIIIDEVLFYVWDPRCLSIDNECREEYLPYLPHVFDLLLHTKDGLDLYDYLVFVEETELGGFKGDTVARRRSSRLVNILLRYRKSIFNKSRNLQAAID